MEIREPAPDKPAAKKGDKPDQKADARKGKPAAPPANEPAAAAPAPQADPEQSAEDGAENAPAPIVVAERSGSGIHAFRSEKWVELYSKKIEDMIGILKSKGVPILWVGLPAVYGQRATSDMLFLDALYRNGANKAGITYVDVWDGFVDEAGRFLPQGPDFEGQIRRLRSADGVYFTKPGARKLAHFVEREIHRVLATRTVPVALPSEPAIPDGVTRPGVPAPRPIAGPIVPLVASSVGTDALLGGSGTLPAGVDPLAARTLVKGEPLSPPAGRADDFVWPRRVIGSEPSPATAALPAGATTTGPAALDPLAKPAVNPAARTRARTSVTPPFIPQLPGFNGARQIQPPAAPPRNRGNTPRPPSPVGPSASTPSPFAR